MMQANRKLTQSRSFFRQKRLSANARKSHAAHITTKLAEPRFPDQIAPPTRCARNNHAKIPEKTPPQKQNSRSASIQKIEKPTHEPPSLRFIEALPLFSR
jgi:hypothetical protein